MFLLERFETYFMEKVWFFAYLGEWLRMLDIREAGLHVSKVKLQVEICASAKLISVYKNHYILEALSWVL